MNKSVLSKRVRNMTRVKHFHNQREIVNNRYRCTVCNYRWPRSVFYANGKSPFSKESRFKRQQITNVLGQAAEVLQSAPMASEYTDPNKFTVPVLRELVSRNRPDLKGVSKMRKPELVAALLKS